MRVLDRPTNQDVTVAVLHHPNDADQAKRIHLHLSIVQRVDAFRLQILDVLRDRDLIDQWKQNISDTQPSIAVLTLSPDFLGHTTSRKLFGDLLDNRARLRILGVQVQSCDVSAGDPKLGETRLICAPDVNARGIDITTRSMDEVGVVVSETVEHLLRSFGNRI